MSSSMRFSLNLKIMRLTTVLFFMMIASGIARAQQSSSYFKDGFLDSLEHRTFNYFWDQTNPSNGLTADRAPTPSFSSVAATGFALTAYPIGVERGWITRDEAVARVLTALRFFWTAPQSQDAVHATGYRGFFYHFLDMKTGLRFEKTELSTIDTALLLAGMLFCQSYFTGEDASEQEIRALTDSIYARVDWSWAMNEGELMSMGWHPENGFIRARWKGYDEAMILYVLALGAPAHAVPDAVWKEWTKSYIWAKYYGKEFVSFGPLFGHQYSHCWIDFRGIRDAYMRDKKSDYFENSRRATYAQHEYAKENPEGFTDYSASIWGFTACDGPGDERYTDAQGRPRRVEGYAARGVSFDWTNDDGTIAPTAPGGSVAFAPEICVPALQAMKEKYGERLYKDYGFLDAFNPTYTKHSKDGWFDVDYLGIDEGPIVIMIENLRNEFVWKTMKKNPYIIRGLYRAGFAAAE